MGSLTELVNRFKVEPGKNPGEPQKNIGKNSRAHLPSELCNLVKGKTGGSL
ncbi:hypothetical protein SAMN04487898_11852 [Pedobacter sp. ok626]|nr:hypothetical protein SAMN04487898_11852 [Pedobacter sp. ok626]